ncbi:6-carboxytetrahydropterin synthase [Motilimonas pumila]|uniref:6-carboxy-5,6,7,8-tetrahydropterin synthase n=1 Tax=Motilimonas pumila TaxID=2303987 RepID=A0A418YBZ0_9GAMM|nr:6-carboxytetrahydropterin synthase [Motilimonas pumila]RJG41982.1 hypothetical protein D1Z90_15210 [Motilimonas pumila]
MKLFVRALTVIDSSFLDVQRGMVGESYQVDVELDGQVNEQNMLLDFSLVKKQIKQIIDAEVDHRLIVPMKVSGIDKQVADDEGQQTELHFPLSSGQYISLSCPEQAFCYLPAEQVNVRTLTTHLESIILAKLPDNISGLTINLSHEIIATPFYHYSHGLKKHDGNCQRIAHGHRSRLDIYVDDLWHKDSVNLWAERWQDIYLGSLEDQVALQKLSIANLNSAESFGFRYQAQQGMFELIMPAHMCDVIDIDTTIESIAEYLCQQVKQSHPDSKVKVLGYEGIGKGAIFEL